MDNAQKELWGITPASLSASIGLILTFIPVVYDAGILLRNIIGLGGLGLIIVSLIINREKGIIGNSLEVKRRRLNYKIHIFILIFALVNVIFSNYLLNK